MGGRDMRRLGGTWRREIIEIVLKLVRNQDAWTYIKRHQVTVSQWVSLWPIFEFHAWETG